jgi:hypothetical protein
MHEPMKFWQREGSIPSVLRRVSQVDILYQKGKSESSIFDGAWSFGLLR